MAKRIKALVITMVAIVLTNVAISFAIAGALPLVPEPPRPKSGMPLVPDPPRPRSGMPIVPEVPRP
jgi:hypothetical protein